jgi:hypothetical protein
VADGSLASRDTHRGYHFRYSSSGGFELTRMANAEREAT